MERKQVLLRLGAVVLATSPLANPAGRAEAQGVTDCQSFGFAQGGVPDAGGDKLVPLGPVTGAQEGDIVVLVAGPVKYTDPSGKTIETEGQSKGKSNATLLIQQGKDPSDVQVFPNGNWVGVPEKMGRNWEDPLVIGQFADCMAAKVRIDNAVTGNVEYIQLGQQGQISDLFVYSPDGGVSGGVSGPSESSVPSGLTEIDWSDPQCRPGRRYFAPIGTVVLGDVLVNDQPRMDKRSDTGLIVDMQSDGVVSCPFGAGFINATTVTGQQQRENMLRDLQRVMETTGCENGCSGGVYIDRWPNTPPQGK